MKPHLLIPVHHNYTIPETLKTHSTTSMLKTTLKPLNRSMMSSLAKKYGFFRPYTKEVIYRYLNCGDLHLGFARVKCPDCGHEYLLAFSCKRRHFCPSCHQKRVVEFGEWLCMEVLKFLTAISSQAYPKFSAATSFMTGVCFQI